MEMQKQNKGRAHSGATQGFSFLLCSLATSSVLAAIEGVASLLGVFVACNN